MEPFIGIAMLTHNRLPLLKMALPSLLRSLTLPAEITIIDNASTDGTEEFLHEFQRKYQYPNVVYMNIVRNKTNVGTVAYNDAMMQFKAPILFEVDDDVVQFPAEWDRKLVDALIHGDRIGYISTDVVQDDWTDGNRADSAKYKTSLDVLPDGSRLEIGMVGGWCAATPRTLFHAMGGFPFKGKELFELEDGAYANKLHEHGLRFAIHTDLKVYHASGPKIAKAMGLWTSWFSKYDPTVSENVMNSVRDHELFQMESDLPEILRVNESVRELVRLLRNEERMLYRFVNVLDRQKLLLFENRYDEFEDSVSEQELLLVQLNRMEYERKVVIGRIAIALQVGDADMSLNELIGHTTGQFDEDWQEARKLLNRISDRLKRIVADSTMKTSQMLINWQESILSLSTGKRSRLRPITTVNGPDVDEFGYAV